MPKLKVLVDEVRKHRDLYYNDEPEISDEEYDVLEDKLKKEVVKLKATPDDLTKLISSDIVKEEIIKEATKILEEVGKDEFDGFEKAEHIMHMHSQEKVNTPADFTKWWNKREIKECVVQYKLDGVSIELQYINGKFVAGITRGDGTVGDDISYNVSKMSCFVEDLIDKSFTGAVRGEIVLFNRTFKEKYEPQGYKNPRNMASGLAKQKRGEGCEDLQIIVYDAKNTIKPFEDETEKNRWLHANRFFVVPTRVYDTTEDVIEWWESIGKKRDDLSFGIDGLVIKNVEIDLEDQARSRPEKQIAFKFCDSIKETILRNVVFERHGHNFTPVCEFDSTELEGTTVSRASIHNHSYIEKLGLYIGCKILIKKAGQIIPQVIKVIE